MLHALSRIEHNCLLQMSGAGCRRPSVLNIPAAPGHSAVASTRSSFRCLDHRCQVACTAFPELHRSSEARAQHSAQGHEPSSRAPALEFLNVDGKDCVLHVVMAANVAV